MLFLSPFGPINYTSGQRHAPQRVDLFLTRPVRCLFLRSSTDMRIQVERAHGLEAVGIVRSGRVHWNLSPASLYEEAIRRGEAALAAEGPLVARTGQHTGRSANDKFFGREPSSWPDTD